MDRNTFEIRLAERDADVKSMKERLTALKEQVKALKYENFDLKEKANELQALNRELQVRNKELDFCASKRFDEVKNYRNAVSVAVESKLKRKREEEPEKSFCDWCGEEEQVDEEYQCQCGKTICPGTALPMAVCLCEECHHEAEGEEDDE